MNRLRRVIAVGLLLIPTALPWSGAAAEDIRRTPVSPVLELDSSPQGPLQSWSGGGAEADVVIEPGLQSTFEKKHIGLVRFSDLVLEFGAGMNPPVYEWIADAWAGKQRLVTGAVLSVDYNMNVVARQEFSGALVKTTLSALDASGKDPATLTLNVRPERTRMSKGGGTVPSDVMMRSGRGWPSSGFRLEIPDLDCSHVRRIEPISVTTDPRKTEVSEIQVTLPESSSDSWNNWLQSFVVNGSNGDSYEKYGDIILLGQGGSELARVHLYNLGIASLERSGGGTADPLRTITVRLYCERMALEWKAGAAGQAMDVRSFGR